MEHIGEQLRRVRLGDAPVVRWIIRSRPNASDRRRVYPVHHQRYKDLLCNACRSFARLCPVDVRREQEPGDQVVTEASLASVPDLKGTDLPDVWRPSTAAEAPARKATDVLYEHHELMRRMIEDMLAAAVTLPLGSPGFRDQLLALQAGILHHAGSEKGSMFREAGRLSDARLYELGARLETMLDEERTSRAKQAFRSLKIGRMEEI